MKSKFRIMYLEVLSFYAVTSFNVNTAKMIYII